MVHNLSIIASKKRKCPTIAVGELYDFLHYKIKSLGLIPNGSFGGIISEWFQGFRVVRDWSEKVKKLSLWVEKVGNCLLKVILGGEKCIITNPLSWLPLRKKSRVFQKFTTDRLYVSFSAVVEYICSFSDS